MDNYPNCFSLSADDRVPQWIKCSDEMPRLSEVPYFNHLKSDEVLICKAGEESYDVDKASLIKDGSRTYWLYRVNDEAPNDIYELDEITHWMPLPEPPPAE